MNEQWRCKREATTLEHSGRSLNHHDRRSEAVVESHGEEAAVARSPPPHEWRQDSTASASPHDRQRGLTQAEAAKRSGRMAPAVLVEDSG
jgi:hypothetical protein